MERDLASLELLETQLRDLRARIEPLRATKERLEEDLLLSRLAVQAIKSRSKEGARSVMLVRDILALESSSLRIQGLARRAMQAQRQEDELSSAKREAK
ncbi:hypothetical protein NDN08_003811 [Rhodosorus marinus]|uniref:Uncharacterized protein n=1 Tax=Rhodosorus marinus TaxID=101924 RepID=A0AAV8UJ87_9RHOD|nr:hypothetical protein NDN08_003811 [Rhodosorus marinus]